MDVSAIFFKDNMKTCSNKNCKQTNPQDLSNFYVNNSRKCGYQSRCKICCKEFFKTPKRKKYQKEYMNKYYKTQSGKKIMKNAELKYQYNINIDDKNKLFNNQNGCCAICNKHESNFKISLHIDHNHVTNKVRGLLCGSCNRAIGLLKDDIHILENAIKYLKEHK